MKMTVSAAILFGLCVAGAAYAQKPNPSPSPSPAPKGDSIVGGPHSPGQLDRVVREMDKSEGRGNNGGGNNGGSKDGGKSGGNGGAKK